MTARHVGAGAVALAGVLLCRSEGRAEAPPWRVEVDAPPECPGQTFFAAELRSRVRDGRRTPEGEVRIKLSGLAPGFRGELLRPGYPPRVVVGDTCEDVARALALVAVIELDSSPKPETPPAQAAPTATERETSALGLGAGLSAGIESAGAMGSPARLAVFGTVISSSKAFAWRLGLARTSSHLASSDVSITRWTGDLDACVGLAGARTALHLDACVRVAAGALLARSADDGATRGWIAPGIVLRPSARLAGPVSVEVGVGVSAPLVRDRFVVARSGSSVEAPPVVIPAGEIGVGFHFP